MSVLTLAGKPINWERPPRPTDKVIWSNKTTGGKIITGSLRTIAHLDHLNTLAIKKFGRGVVVFQGPYNTTVPASAGTHDYDACLDVYIPGIPWLTQQAFFRANGAGAYARTKPTFSTEHIHYFTLPVRKGAVVSDDYREGGFKVGYLVDGGWSTNGKPVASSQIDDYYKHKNALANHAPDPTWFPPNISATIFDLDAYIARQVPKMGALAVMTANIASKERVPQLAQVLKKYGPHVVIVTEAYYAREFLKGIEGYRSYQYTKSLGEEGPDIAVLVRRGVKVSRRRALEMAEKWLSPKGKRREPRVYPSLNVEVDKFSWRLLGLHFPTHGNPKAQEESERAVNKWLAAVDRRSVATGDFNQFANEIIDWVRGAKVVPGTKVDHAVYARAGHTKTTVLRKEQPEGMHGWVIYQFTTGPTTNTKKKG